jgi:hypothetical protein
MALLKNNQFVHERNSWKIKLEHFQQENVLLKYRLSKMVDDNEGRKFLQMAEYFQNELLIIDVMLEKLFNELEKFSGLSPENKKENAPSQEVTTDYNKLKKSFAHFENKFLNLLKEFNEKMLENSNH